jgi:hypothetical protein
MTGSWAISEHTLDDDVTRGAVFVLGAREIDLGHAAAREAPEDVVATKPGDGWVTRNVLRAEEIDAKRRRLHIAVIIREVR